ncbi:MAG: cysteine desulfurase family protein [Patescibacteria group bacterium]
MNRLRNSKIYLDYTSATPVLPEVRRAMEKYWSQDFYNPSAIYKEGLRVKEEIKECRARVARALRVAPNGIIFTSGGTESDNLAILGLFEASKKKLKQPHIIISAIEHPAVVAAAQEVVRRGGKMSILEVNEEGIVSVETLKDLVKKNTFLVSVGLANGEIGTIQPISKIGRFLSQFRKEHASIYPYLHTDASQTPSYLNVCLDSLNTDLLTLDGSKIYGPKGIGILAIRKGVKIHPIILGGGQEDGRRSGTLNLALVSGFVLSLEKVQQHREKELLRLEVLRQYFIQSVCKCLPQAIINGAPKNHLPNIVSVSVPGILSEFILLKLDQFGVMVSVGSACSLDGRVSGSPVISALGKKDLAESTLRFSFGRLTTLNEIKYAIKIFCLICNYVIK